MKNTGLLLAVIGLCGLATGQVSNPPADTVQSQDGEPVAVYRVTVVARTIKVINYRHRSGSTNVGFKGTALMPEARGEARVESKQGAIKVQAQFQKLQPPSQFGPEYLTYVLWAISPEGRPTNLGEVVLGGTKSKLEVTSELQAFAMLVTAEPHFAVMQPSDVVVLENEVRWDTQGNVEDMTAKVELLPRGGYSRILGDAPAARMDPRIPLGLYEARNAVQIAKGAGADRYAASSFQKAVQHLSEAETYQTHKGGKKAVETAAREAAQMAEDARVITMKRREEERLAQERKAAAERQAKAQAEAEEAVRQKQQAEVARAEAERAKLEAQLAAERAARERMEAEAARAAALAQQQAAQAEADRARQAAQASLLQQQAAQAETEKARLAAQEADRLRQQAEADKAELRTRLMNQLNSILQTRDSVRGLIVNMSDVLFDTGSYTLKPITREKLAKISGILLAYPGLRLEVEGHTDAVGSDEYNQMLSEQRAGSVRAYLVEQGVAASAITARGFGKTRPVASNESASGRQQNRRVELVVNGDAISASLTNSESSPR